jgi:hypothetical protein
LANGLMIKELSCLTISSVCHLTLSPMNLYHHLLIQHSCHNMEGFLCECKCCVHCPMMIASRRGNKLFTQLWSLNLWLCGGFWGTW